MSAPSMFETGTTLTFETHLPPGLVSLAEAYGITSLIAAAA